MTVVAESATTADDLVVEHERFSRRLARKLASRRRGVDADAAESDALGVLCHTARIADKIRNPSFKDYLREAITDRITGRLGEGRYAVREHRPLHDDDGAVVNEPGRCDALSEEQVLDEYGLVGEERELVRLVAFEGLTQHEAMTRLYGGKRAEQTSRGYVAGVFDRLRERLAVEGGGR